MDTMQQCQAHSRLGKRSKNFPVKGKKVCKLHGGWSTGPRTEEGRECIRQARTKHGRYSAKTIKERLDFRLLMQSYRNELQEVTEHL